MREILFRGKRKDCNAWETGYYSEYDFSDGRKHFINGFEYEVYPETVGQFTGLTANGKKIFEDDILQFNYTGKNLGVEGKAAVIFENGKFGVLWGWHKELVCLDGFANTTIEVIGNIHDNPELLGVVEDGK